jgi:ferritin
MEKITINRKKNPFATPSVIEALNYRIEQEEYSSRMYHSMAMWLNDNGFMGAYKEWDKYNHEEMSHANWTKEYLLDMGIQPKIPALKEPPQTFAGLPDIIRKSYDHEIDITMQCNDLAKKALSTSDHLLYQLATKYMHEQQEEIGKLQTLLDKLEAFGEDKIALRLLDNELGS